MSPELPFLLLRAVPKAGERERFEAWFLGVHARDVLRIPGFVQVQQGFGANGMAWSVYTFESAECVPSTLQSNEAAYARGTWAEWSEALEEMSVELFATLVTIPGYHSIN